MLLKSTWNSDVLDIRGILKSRKYGDNVCHRHRRDHRDQPSIFIQCMKESSLGLWNICKSHRFTVEKCLFFFLPAEILCIYKLFYNLECVLVVSNSLQLHLDYQVPLSMGFSRQEYWSSLLQGIFPTTQGLNLGILHCRQILCCLSHQGNSYILQGKIQRCKVWSY